MKDLTQREELDRVFEESKQKALDDLFETIDKQILQAAKENYQETLVYVNQTARRLIDFNKDVYPKLIEKGYLPIVEYSETATYTEAMHISVRWDAKSLSVLQKIKSGAVGYEDGEVITYLSLFGHKIQTAWVVTTIFMTLFIAFMIIIATILT